MKLLMKWMILILLIQALLISGACGISVGGGYAVGIDRPGEVGGQALATNNGVSSTASSSEPVDFEGRWYVEDASGKGAEIYLNVIQGIIKKQKIEFKPKQGNLMTTEKEVSAKQTLDIQSADSITASAVSWDTVTGSDGSHDSAYVEINAMGGTDFRSNGFKASFVGSVGASAGATYAKAEATGAIKGIIGTSSVIGWIPIRNSYLSAGSSRNSDPNGDSTGLIDCTMSMKAASGKGISDINELFKFNVDDAKNQKIQSAVDASQDGDTINVAKGTYYENIEIVDKSISLTGAGIGKTIIDGNNAGSVFNIRGAGFPDPSAKVSLSGMTIQGGTGYSDGSSSPNGGGIYNTGNLLVTKCSILNNDVSPDGAGGGIYNDGIMTITGSTISGNSANVGGGIYNWGTATITGSTISGNSAINSGGIFNVGTLKLDKDTITENTANYEGGGIDNWGTAIITGSTISNNQATYYGGGISTNYGTTNIAGCTISKNIAPYGGGIYNWEEAIMTFASSTVSGNNGGESSEGYGSGVVNHGSFIMNSGTITGNQASEGLDGGGVYNGESGTFIMNSGTISKNIADNGAGVYNDGSFTMNAGSISENSVRDTESGSGGGVFNNNIFTMATTKAEIKKNTAALGGGVVNNGEFTMNSGTISDNKAMIDNGGGIYNGATLFISGDSKIKSNTANLGGGIYSSGSLIFDGKKLSVTGNKAHEPSSVEEWYMGYGVYSESEPETSGGFNTKQVTVGNSKF